MPEGSHASHCHASHWHTHPTVTHPNGTHPNGTHPKGGVCRPRTLMLASSPPSQEIFDEWLLLQRVWLYLAPLFNSEDIVEHLPHETRRFAAVDALWRKTMADALRTKNALRVCNAPELWKKLSDANRFLEKIQKGLNDYLDTKRLAFPRFFFLSNDELLEILAQSKNPRAVQPHLPKCFEGIATLAFEELEVPELEAVDDGSSRPRTTSVAEAALQRRVVITAMFSIERERVGFIEYIDPNEGDKKGNVER